MLIGLALFLMLGTPELSPGWLTGLGIAMVMGGTYVTGEIAAMLGRKERPCGHCGEAVPQKSFRVRLACPHCQEPLE